MFHVSRRLVRMADLLRDRDRNIVLEDQAQDYIR
jgi:hypothetical protein